ncbi:translation initiation factor IF-2 subunit alpha [Candidatus Woesearchaeota archaeon]|nr:translation initiation factor IF-2 subunit alpha [Candidatus Woesearchaeota archaeon]
MLYRKAGIPEESELVMCTVTKIQYNAVFANLDEYDNKSGMIHISEIAPGRIRNIRDFVKEGKKIVCVVLRVDRERGHIDLSLRRVSEGQQRTKVNQLKQEAIAEKIIEMLARELKKEVRKLYDEITDKIFQKYDMLHPCFQEVSRNETSLTGLGLAPDIAEKLAKLISQRIKPPEVLLQGRLQLKSYADTGVEVIKDALLQGQKAGGEHLLIKYLGAGTYHISITAEDYKTAEAGLKKCLDTIEALMKKIQGIFSFARTEKK